ncbi:retrotransposon protein, putative, ty1-copia subclass [Tanacetum coccineum]
MTTTVVNNSLFRSLFEKQKLTGNNFLEWYYNLRIVLSTEDKLPFLEQPIPILPVLPQGQANTPDVITTHQAWVKAQKEIAGLMLMTKDPKIQKTLEHLGAYDMLKELKTLKDPEKPKEKSHKAAKGNQWKGKAKIGYVPVQALPFASKPKNPPTPKKYNTAKDVICHQCGEETEVGAARRVSVRGAWSRAELKLWRIFICVSLRGLFYFATFVTMLPPFTSGIILVVSRLYKDGFVNRFKDDNYISVFKNNMIYFNAIHRYDIYEIVMSSSNTNECSMYAVTNKRAKLNLDSALLWHCRLRHINKKRIEKLQHDGLLDSTDIESFEKCVACMSGKMARKPYSHQVERAKDLLGLIHTDDHRIIAYRTPPYTPHHNEVSERRNRTLLDMVRSMMSQTTLPKSFWDYALESAARILNMVPTKKRDTLTKPDKLEPRALKCIFVGYPKETMGYSFYYPPENKVFVARNAKFFENEVIDHEANRSLEDLEIIQEEDTHPSLDTSLDHEEDDQEVDEPQSDLNPIRRSIRTRRPTDRLCLYVDAEEHELVDLGEPANYKAALLDPKSDKWLNAMNVEMQSMKDNKVWELIELPPDAKTVGHKWLFKKKTDMDGAVHTYKARLVAKGFTQTPGIDYEETFSPVADIRAIRILIAIAAFYGYEIWQMDVKTAFLNGYLNEEVYMEQPKGFVSQKYPNRVCKLKRSIYGLKQASTQWNKRFDDEIKKFGFNQNRDEPCVYVKASGSYVTFLILYINDILIMGNNIPMLQNVKSYLGRCFAMKDLGEATYILRIKIYQDRIKAINWVSCYTDAGYLTDANDMKSQTGYVFVLNGGAVDRKSTKQSIFATSSIDVEYIAVLMHRKRLHFRAKVHYLRETIEMGDVRIEKVDTDDNLADPFTKALAFPKHSELTEENILIPTSSLDLRCKQVLHVWISLFESKSNAILNKVVIKAILGSDVKQHPQHL